MGASHLDVDSRHLRSFDPQLYRHLVAYPSEVIPALDEVLKEKKDQVLAAERARETGLEALAAAGGEEALSALALESRPFNLEAATNMRALNPEDIDSLIAVQGMVIRCGSLLPEMKVAFFQCTVCGHCAEEVVIDGELSQPVKCLNPLCQSSHSYQLIHNRCQFEDKQLVKLQETPDSIPEGETPHSVSLYLYKDVVDSVKPGDRVEVTGVFRALAARTNPRQSTLQTVYKTYIDAIHIRKQDVHQHSGQQRGGREEERDAELSLSPAGEDDVGSQRLRAQIEELSRDPALYERLVASLAPSIWEMDDVKKSHAQPHSQSLAR